LRRNWLDPEGASESELKKRTLTNLYNQRLKVRLISELGRDGVQGFLVSYFLPSVRPFLVLTRKATRLGSGQFVRQALKLRRVYQSATIRSRAR
jgi:hypothetical protein